MHTLMTKMLHLLEPEQAHHLAILALRLWGRYGDLATINDSFHQAAPIEVMGLQFPNRIGLAAGFDKNAQAVDGLAKLGFGFIEVGTVTPRAQPGNTGPRLFRLKDAHAIINRLGFNNAGVVQLLKNLSGCRYTGILGINIGKNASTAIEDAAKDYVLALQQVYARASYVTVNISSPNTPGLRQLQGSDFLNELLDVLMEARLKLLTAHGRKVPLVVKLAPDLSHADLDALCDVLLAHHVDGVIATNTTLLRPNIQDLPHADEAGGLSGAPLTQMSTEMLFFLSQRLKNHIPLIASGGIMSLTDAEAKIQAGASLVQIYTGMVYQGPRLITSLIRDLKDTPSTLVS